MPRGAYRVRTTVAAAALMAVTLGAPVAYGTWEGGDGQAAVPAGAAAPQERYTETRLFFGTERPDGGPAVTEKQFRAFVDRQVTPYFPDGLTVQEGQGQWRNESGEIAKERSYELVLFYPQTEAKERDARIERIRTAYRVEFAQESVARVEDRVRISF